MNVFDLPQHAPSRLISKRDDRRVETNLVATDATTALTRGVAEYAAQLEILTPEGRTLGFAVSYDAWATPEEEKDYPGFVAYTNDTESTYDWASMSRNISTNRFADGTWLVTGAELVTELKCEVWATDPEERHALVRMLEQAFNPVDWMQGFRLELPHYFNQRATYELTKITYLGGSTEALQNVVNARLVLKASVPVTQLMPFRTPIIRVRHEIDGVEEARPAGGRIVGVDETKNP